MTPEQFACWLRGFTDGIKGKPTDIQWAAITSLMDSVFSTPTPISVPSADVKETARELVTVAQAAERIQMSGSFIRMAMKDGRLPFVRIGRSVRVKIGDVDLVYASPRVRNIDTSEATPDHP